VTDTEALILEQLADGTEKYGLQMIADSEGKLKQGTIYVLLSRLQAKGFVTSRAETRPEGQFGIPRRLYQITGAGGSVLRARAAYLAALRGVVHV